ncbi:MAG: hypothetical protein JXA25_00815 [Anaerolineales bacterium]|nr:hypothetical protein [Anaerolineales bacterium]
MRLTFRKVLYAGLSLCFTLAFAVSCTPNIPLPLSTPTIRPTPEPTQPVVFAGDYGDAPDGSQGMDTGYYGAGGGPYVFTYSSLGTSARFPTLADSQPPGPFTIDVDEFWIGPLFGSSSSDDIPSLEEDADDPNDPDQVPNLNLQASKADCDRENGTHNPDSTGCQPVPPYSIPMNARILVFFGYPPLGLWITSVSAADTATYSSPIYWNLLIDLNQDGQWGHGEWIAQDVSVSLAPGETQMLISPAFQFPSGGTPWGRLTFPFWVRSTVTSERVRDVVGMENWDGRGTDSGFEMGEIEDYFVEWYPLGQQFQDTPPLEQSGCIPELTGGFTNTPPVEVDPGGTIALSPLNTEQLEIAVLPDAASGGPAFVLGTFPIFEEQYLDFQQDVWNIQISVDGIGNAYVHPNDVPDNAANPAVVVQQGPFESQPCQGTGQVQVQGGLISLIKKPEDRGGLSHFGVWLFESVVKEGQEHHPFVQLLKTFRVLARQGSIHFEGEPPWVDVSGELEEDGSFYAEGSGVVAGYANISVTFEGLIQDGTLTGDYTMGANGELPGGFPIVYGITGTYEGPDDTTQEESIASITAGERSAADSFIAAFNAAFEEQDTESLYTLLDPAVITRYGEDTCRAYLQAVTETPTSISLVDLTREGSWDWERDGLSEVVHSTFTASVEFSAAGETSLQELHLSLPGDNSVRWFTDCGDPLP